MTDFSSFFIILPIYYLEYALTLNLILNEALWYNHIATQYIADFASLGSLIFKVRSDV